MTLQIDKLMEMDGNISTGEKNSGGGLYDESSDKLFVPKQFIPKSYYDQHSEHRKKEF